MDSKQLLLTDLQPHSVQAQQYREETVSHAGDSPTREDATARVAGRVLVFPGLVMWMTTVSPCSAWL